MIFFNDVESTWNPYDNVYSFRNLFGAWMKEGEKKEAWYQVDMERRERRTLLQNLSVILERHIRESQKSKRMSEGSYLFGKVYLHHET